MGCVTNSDALRQSSSEADRVSAALQGDTRAFEELYHLAYPAVRARLCHLLGPDGPREDLAQEAFIVAHRQLARLKDGHAFTAWVTKIATNLAHGWARRHVQRFR